MSWFRGVLVLFLLLGAGSALAQDDDVRSAAERSAACLQLDSPVARLACLEAAAEAASAALGAADEAPPPPAIAPLPESSAPAAAIVAEPAAPAEPAAGTSVAATPPQVTATAPVAAPAPLTPEASGERIRADRIEEESRPSLLARLRPERPDEINLVINRITINRRDKRHKFYTAAGEVLLQADIRQNFRPPSALPAEATVEYGVLGSKWISFADRPNRKYKVTLID